MKADESNQPACIRDYEYKAWTWFTEDEKDNPTRTQPAGCRNECVGVTVSKQPSSGKNYCNYNMLEKDAPTETLIGTMAAVWVVKRAVLKVHPVGLLGETLLWGSQMAVAAGGAGLATYQELNLKWP